MHILSWLPLGNPFDPTIIAHFITCPVHFIWNKISTDRSYIALSIVFLCSLNPSSQGFGTVCENTLSVCHVNMPHRLPKATMSFLFFDKVSHTAFLNNFPSYRFPPQHKALI